MAHKSEPGTSGGCPAASPRSESGLRLVEAAERIASALEGLLQLHAAVGDSAAQARSADDIPGGQAAAAASGSAESTAVVPSAWFARIEGELGSIRASLERLERVELSAEKQWYTVRELADRTAYRPWTIRDACNKSRIRAEKGDDGQWRIPHEEMVRIRERGLPSEKAVDAEGE